MTFEQFWQECLALAYSERQRMLMGEMKNLYREYYEADKTPEEAMGLEWGA